MCPEDRTRKFAGRLVKVNQDVVEIQASSGIHAVRVNEPGSARPGDWVEVSNGSLRILTPNRNPLRRCSRMEHTLDPRRLHATRIRARVESGIRDFFLGQDFLEVRTPLLVPCPGMEPHIRPFAAQGWATDSENHGLFLPTSPEFAMKRLLVGGLERIFQICPAFRDEPRSVTHLPEFTMLEWYRSRAGYEDLMADTEHLICELARAIHGKSEIPFQGRSISVETPWPRLRIRDLFLEKTGIDLTTDSDLSAMRAHADRFRLGWRKDESWDDLYFKIWLNLIEPELPRDRAVFVRDFPPSQAALSTVFSEPDGSRWARRFEAYAGGLELCNAFEELTDPIEQRRRFIEDMELRTRTYGDTLPANPLDERFLAALEEGMPPSSGNALGVDRLIMLLADETDIRYTVWLDD